MISKCKQLYQKYHEIIAYLFYGGCTTLVNWVIYFPLTNFLGVHYQVSNVIAWIGAVLFAYVTNKTRVFQNTSCDKRSVVKEVIMFFGARIFSLLVEMGIMYITVTVFCCNENVMKIVVAIITVILNYIASKLLIFKKKGK